MMCHMKKTEISSLPWDDASAFRPPMSLEKSSREIISISNRG